VAPVQPRAYEILVRKILGAAKKPAVVMLQVRGRGGACTLVGARARPFGAGALGMSARGDALNCGCWSWVGLWVPSACSICERMPVLLGPRRALCGQLPAAQSWMFDLQCKGAIQSQPAIRPPPIHNS
jgi:hypothetical protein